MNVEYNNKTIIRFIFRLFSYAKMLTLIMFFLVLGNTIFLYIIPVYTQKVVDGVLGTTQNNGNHWTIIIYAGILLIATCSANFERYIAVKHSEVVEEHFRHDFFRIILRKKYVNYCQTSYGDIETVMTSCVDDICDTTYCFVEAIIAYPIGLIFGISYILDISIWLVLLLLVQLVLNYGIMHHGAMLQNKAQKEKYNAHSNYFSVLSGLFHGYENIRLLFLLQKADEKHEKESKAVTRANTKMAWVNCISISLLLELSNFLLNIAVIIIFCGLVQNNQSSIGEYLAFVAMKEAIIGSFNGFIKLKANKATFDAAIEKINEVEFLEDFLTYDFAPSGTKMAKNTCVVLDHVAYTYPNSSQEFLFDYKFEKGHCYMLTGENGVGKSTFVRLLSGILSEDININTGGAIIKILPQKITLFEENIVDILLDANTRVSEELATQFGVLHIIDEIRNGENIAIGSLSGGEKKKILLSLLLGVQSDILILDEPFAEIDVASKDIMVKAIRSCIHDRIVILITHDIPDLLLDCTTMIHVEKRNGVSRFV